MMLSKGFKYGGHLNVDGRGLDKTLPVQDRIKRLKYEIGLS